jgi:DNA end-binding protein Ku
LREVRGSVSAAEAKLAQQVIESYQGPLDLATYTDEYQAGLRAIIDAKVAGEEVVAPKEEAAPKVIDLMEALRRSLDQVSAGKKPVAKVAEAAAPPAAKKAPKAAAAAKAVARKRKAS